MGAGGPADTGFGIDEVNDLTVKFVAFPVFGKLFFKNGFKKFFFFCRQFEGAGFAFGLAGENQAGNGGDLFLVRPLDYAYCLKRIEKFKLMRERKSCFDLAESPKRAAIRRLQIRLNMPISITGFLYLQESVLLAMEDPQALHRMTTVLYPCVALQFQTSSKNVERCIRNAVEKTFEQGDLSMLQRYFPHFLGNKNGKPNNKEFIGYLVELAKDQLFDLKQ